MIDVLLNCTPQQAHALGKQLQEAALRVGAAQGERPSAYLYVRAEIEGKAIRVRVGS